MADITDLSALIDGIFLTDKVADDDSPTPVSIGTIHLGERRDDAPDTAIPNPTQIRWYQDFKAVPKDITGGKPVTIVTVPEALWYCEVDFNALNNRSEVLDIVLKMNAGPYLITDADHTNVCMILLHKELTQKKGTQDWYRQIKLKFMENNPGVV